MPLRAPLPLLFACLACPACSGMFAKGDGRAIGDDLGRFSIEANLRDSTCGDGAPPSVGNTTFDVFLSEAPPRVYWNSGPDSVEGDLDPDGVHFDFQSETVVAVPGAESAAATCAIVRTDHAAGAFDDAKNVTELHGTLEYHFAPQGRSDCSTAVAAQGFAALPCTARYDMAGKYVSAR